MSVFLLELLTEEIPARMQVRAADELGRLFGEAMAARGVAVSAETHVTPRRLALIARGLPERTAATREERRGPRADAPEGAIAGFLKSAGVAREALEARDDPKGRFLYAVIEKPGRAVADVLADAVPDAVGKLAWPKSMRWGAASASMDSPRWVRPLSGVVALLDADVVPLRVLGLAAGRTTRGHRFMSAGAIAIASAETYAGQLRAAFVVLDADERRRIIAEGARAAAAAHGLVLVEDPGLVAENAGLTEWPVPLLGRFDPAFLEVPREAIQLTMRVNQKYFACVDADGALAPAFVCVANIAAADGGAGIIEGNRRVLAARLSDARFFWEQDRAKPLADYLPGLERIVFHEKLGTMLDKAERVAKLARWLVESGAVRPSMPGSAPPPNPPHKGEGLDGDRTSALPLVGRDGVGVLSAERLADMAERAGLLAKADLVSAMVGEFPELQGVMGGHYALASGENVAVAAAVRDHYKPVGPGDAVPSAPVSVAVALADKLDSLASFFAISEQPTGSRDPFALRRACLGAIRLIQLSSMRLPLVPFLDFAIRLAQETMHAAHGRRIQQQAQQLKEITGGSVLAGFATATVMRSRAGFAEQHLVETFDLLDFCADRLKVQQREAGVRHDLIDAVFALGGEDDIVRLLARVRALQAFIGTADGANLLAGYKRAANIMAIEAKRDGVERFEASPPPSPSLPAVAFPSPADAGEGQARERQGEGGLGAALSAVAAEAATAVAAEDFTAAMAALARLRGPIDAFFEATMVNDPDPAIRLANLSLLQRFVDAVHTVADFSRIEG